MEKENETNFVFDGNIKKTCNQLHNDSICSTNISDGSSPTCRRYAMSSSVPKSMSIR